MKINLSVIIPVFNEEKTLLEILNKVQILKNKANLEIIIINDGSTDKTKEIIEGNKNLYQTNIELKKNFGKGKAVIEGLKKASSEYIYIQDADLEYDPEDILKFIQKIEIEKADLVIGSRFTNSNRSVLYFWHMIGNKFITLLFNLLNNTTFTDIYCCYLIFKKENISFEKLKSFGWGQQAEILTYLVSNSNKMFEIGVYYNARKYSEGKKIKYSNVFEVIFWIILSRLKKIKNKK